MNHKFTTEIGRIDEGDIHGDIFVITVLQICADDEDKIVFNPPVQIEVSKFVGENYFTIFWDFGMSWKCSQEEWGRVDLNDYKFKESIMNGVLFDLEHAFFHTSHDPNYTHRHYALIGCLGLLRQKNLRRRNRRKIAYIP